MSAEKRWDLLWRGVMFVATTVGPYFFLVLTVLARDDRESRFLLLAVVPLVTGFICALAPMEPRTRVLLLWVAAALLGIMAVLTLFAFGLLFVFVVAAYVMSAWMLNEATAPPE